MLWLKIHWEKNCGCVGFAHWPLTNANDNFIYQSEVICVSLGAQLLPQGWNPQGARELTWSAHLTLLLDCARVVTSFLFYKYKQQDRMQFLQPLWWTLHGKTNLAIIIQARHSIQRIVFVKNFVEKTRSVGRRNRFMQFFFFKGSFWCMYPVCPTFSSVLGKTRVELLTSHWVHTRKTKKLRNELKNREKKTNVNFLGFAGWPTIGEWDVIALKTIHHNLFLDVRIFVPYKILRAIFASCAFEVVKHGIKLVQSFYL